MYLASVAELTDEQFSKAAGLWLKTGKFFPKPVELLELVYGNAEDGLEQQAQQAWLIVSDSASRYGSYAHVDFEDRLINATIRSLGGWPEILARPASEFDVWTRKEFLRTYQSLARAGVDGEICAPLPGLSQVGGVQRVDGGEHVIRPLIERVAGLTSTPKLEDRNAGA